MDLTATWCHWCHVMDETTYRDPTVVALVNELFVPVRVDTDQRPDIQARYLMGGWPTTAFLTPEGDVLTGYTYVPPEELVPILRQVSQYFAENREDIAQQMKLLREQQSQNSGQAASGVPTDTVRSALQRLEQDYDPVHGGFTPRSKFPFPAAVELALRHAHANQDHVWLDRALHTLDGASRLLDPVWGGLFRYSVTPDWATPHHEKLLSVNASTLANFVKAYAATHDVRFRAAAESILSYTETFLTDPAGGFYGSQDADLVLPGMPGIAMEGEAYFLLNDAERRSLGIPRVDRTLYVDANGEMSTAFLDASVVLEDPNLKKTALQAVERLWAGARGAQGYMWHSTAPADRSDQRQVATLMDQMQFGLALLAAYSHTGQPSYLERAQALALYSLTNLRDEDRGGFFALPADPSAPASWTVRTKPCGDNIAAARFFTRLHRYSMRPEYDEAARGALLLCADVAKESPDYALAADDWLNYPLTLVVVGTPGTPDVDALITTAHQAYEPGKVVVVLDPSRGPPQLGELTYPADPAAVYVCRDRLCSLPAFTAQDLNLQMQQLADTANR